MQAEEMNEVGPQQQQPQRGVNNSRLNKYIFNSFIAFIFVTQVGGELVRYYRRKEYDETTYATTTTFVVNNSLIILGRFWILVLFVVALTRIFSARNVGVVNTHSRSLCNFSTHIVLLVLLIVSSIVRSKLLMDYFKAKTEVTYAEILGLFMIEQFSVWLTNALLLRYIAFYKHKMQRYAY